MIITIKIMTMEMIKIENIIKTITMNTKNEYKISYDKEIFLECGYKKKLFYIHF